MIVISFQIQLLQTLRLPQKRFEALHYKLRTTYRRWFQRGFETR